MIESWLTFPLRLAPMLAPPPWQWTVAIGLYVLAVIFRLSILVLGWLALAVLVDLIRKTISRSGGPEECKFEGRPRVLP